jgi:protein-tyrosine phosphatase
VLITSVEGRSPTIVAAYLMYTLAITPEEAMDMILERRPFVQYVFPVVKVYLTDKLDRTRTFSAS